MYDYERNALDILRELVDAQQDVERDLKDPADPNEIRLSLRRQKTRRLKLLWEEAERYVRNS